MSVLRQATEVVDPVPGAASPHLPQQPDLVQLCTPEGERVEHPDYSVDLSDEELRGLYRDLALVRRWDVEATALQRQGELGIWASLLGQEAAQVGAGRAMQADDMAFPTYREHGVAWTRGVDPLAGDEPVPGRGQRRLGPGRPRLQPLHDRHRLAVPARDRLRDGRAARRRGERRPRVPGRRRDQPGRGQRGDDLRRELLRAGRLLLPEQPVRDQRAARAPDAGAAVPAGRGLRVPRRAGRRQRRPRRPRRDPGRAARRPRGPGTDVHRGVHLPDGRAHHLRRPHPLPAGQRAGGVEAARPDRPVQGLPVAQRDRRRRVLRERRRRGRRAGRPHPQRHARDARPRPDQHVRPRLRRADAAAGRPARGVRRVPRELRGGEK